MVCHLRFKMDIDRIRKFVTYNPDTGLFVWNFATPDMFDDKIRTAEMRCRMFNSRFPGKEAFTSIDGNGYKSAVIMGHRTTAHRVAWIIYYGVIPDNIDHINGIRTDNRICNLRSVTQAENAKNMRKSKRNKSGHVGVRFEQRRQKWIADIRVDRELIFLGRFEQKEDALAARKAAERKFLFHSNHGH